MSVEEKHLLSETVFDSVYEQLKQYSEVTNLGEPNDFLGLQIECRPEAQYFSGRLYRPSWG